MQSKLEVTLPTLSTREKIQVLLVGILILAIFLNRFFYVVGIKGDSMIPTYKSGDKIFFERFVSFSSLKQGDVILFEHEEEKLIKRIWFINSQKEIAVLGDNLKNSEDSRMIGFIQFSDIKGKAVFPKYYPIAGIPHDRVSEEYFIP